MTQRNIYKEFKRLFPQYVEAIYQWYFIASNSICIRTYFDKYFVFTYNNKTDWCFETAVSYVYNGRRM